MWVGAIGRWKAMIIAASASIRSGSREAVGPSLLIEHDVSQLGRNQGDT